MPKNVTKNVIIIIMSPITMMIIPLMLLLPLSQLDADYDNCKMANVLCYYDDELDDHVHAWYDDDGGDYGEMETESLTKLPMKYHYHEDHRSWSN